MTSSMKWRVGAVAALVAAQLGCRSDSTTDPGPEGLNIEALSPTSIVGTVGGFSPVAPAIRVTGSRTGRPQVDVRVQFILPQPGGSVGTYSVVTDSAGVASAGEWRFAQRSGLNELFVVVGGSHALTFSAMLRPDVPDHLRPLVTQDQAGIAGQTIEGFSLVVQDRFLNPLPGVEVKFSIVDGGGTLETEKAVTDEYGVALARGWHLGGTPGTNQASASVAGIDPVLFRAEGLDSADVKWYKLEVLRNGSNEIKLAAAGIADARFGLTPFDKCLCRKQQGYFLENITYSNGDNLFNVNASGLYDLNGAELSTELSWTQGSIDGDLVLLQRRDPEWDSPNITWVYRAVTSSGQ
jgi:hypothetical protein